AITASTCRPWSYHRRFLPNRENLEAATFRRRQIGVATGSEAARWVNDDGWRGHLARGKGRPTDDDSVAEGIFSLLTPEADVLDIGCGSGHLLLRLHERGHRAVGVDVSSAALSICRDFGLRVYKCDVEASGLPLNLKRASFDFVVMADVVEH